MKNFKNFAILGLLSVATIFSGCDKDNDPIPQDQDERTDRKLIETGLDVVVTKDGKLTDYTAFAWKVEAKSNYDVLASGADEPNFNELERGGIMSNGKFVYTRYGSKGRDFYEAVPEGKYLIYVITQGRRQDQSGAFTIVDVKKGQVTKLRKNFSKSAPYYGQW